MLGARFFLMWSSLDHVQLINDAMSAVADLAPLPQFLAVFGLASALIGSLFSILGGD